MSAIVFLIALLLSAPVAIIGAATAQIAVMSRAVVSEMKAEGYDEGFAATTTAGGGLLAPVILPSRMFVVFGVLAQVPIGEMFIAGIILGLLPGTGICLGNHKDRLVPAISKR